MTAWIRSRSPNLASTLLTWALTVGGRRGWRATGDERLDQLLGRGVLQQEPTVLRRLAAEAEGVGPVER